MMADSILIDEPKKADHSTLPHKSVSLETKALAQDCFHFLNDHYPYQLPQGSDDDTTRTPLEAYLLIRVAHATSQAALNRIDHVSLFPGATTQGEMPEEVWGEFNRRARTAIDELRRQNTK